MKVIEALTLLELLGSDQWGLVTTAQATANGVTRNMLARMADDGTLQRVRHGVYALPSATHGPLQDLRAAWLATDSKTFAGQRVASDVVVSGASAASVHRLGDLVPSRHEFTSPIRRQSAQPDVRYRRRELHDADVTVIDGLPVTSVVRTVSDLADDQTDFDHLAEVVRDALNQPQVRASELSAILAPQAARFGAEGGKELLTRMVRASGADHKAADLAETLLSSRVAEVIARGREQVDRLLEERIMNLPVAADLAEKMEEALRRVLDDHDRSLTIRKAPANGTHRSTDR